MDTICRRLISIRSNSHFLFFASQSGFSLLFVIASLITLSAIIVAISKLTPNAPLTTLAGVFEQRAYYLALSGINFWSPGKTGVFAIDGDFFTLSESAPDAAGYCTITSIGTVRSGSGMETNIRVTAKRLLAETITFQNNLNDFKTPVVGENANNANAILVFGSDPDNAPATLSTAQWTTLWSQNVSRYAGGWVRLGGDTANTTGALWYTGASTSCAAGKCAFAKGLRAFFGFSFAGCDASIDSKQNGDGFTFAVVTGANDLATAAGGSDKSGRGEYLGYAGPGPSGQGITPPKMAVEIDTFPNRGSGSPTESNTRRDKSNANHVAVVYWGDAATVYDDNVHGAGTDPANPANTSAGYGEKKASASGANWLEDGEEHCLRLEIHRDSDAGQGVYILLAWVDPTGTGRDDVTADYTSQTPQLSNTVRLGAADHARLDTVSFGWTEATGKETQSVAIHDFALAFRR